ncbi:platelet glycoprotein 4 [Salmo salar]|uniref:Platelet glycoprotein 4 n=1 Tax=Salmo salar TaxID=8030 RepID=A0A1S3SHN0_SALSA|nr:platelet glycoprotein 4-like [Salmo salar]|eukprot:XP_014063845.1 PREDICTED: platelet glycoprotein 4-like [Salmo salar]
MGCCNKLCGLKAGIGAGIAVAILGIILIPVGNNIIRETVTKESVIEPGTTAWNNWVSADAPVYRQFWLFDVQNPLDVVENGSKPKLVEKGPYTYKTRYLPKENITANPENHTISFLLPAGAIFEPSMSVGSEEDSVTSLNLAVAGGYKLFPPWVLEAAIKLNNVSLFQRRTVREILWGYKDPILKGTLGLFFPYNGTYDGPYSVFTGKDDISKVSIIDSWQGEKKVSFWNNTYCDMINGTDGSSFSPFLDKKKPLYFFSPDISRSVSAEYERSLNLKGIEVYRFKLPPLTLASPAVNPDNQCFCTDSVVSKNCTLAGVLDITSSRGQPVYISLPHFLHGSPYLVEDVEGLGPSEEHHVTFLDVEPTTGFSLRFAKRLQVNMMYGPSKIITVLKKVKDYTILPIVWLNETASLDDETADRFKKELLSRVDMLETVQFTLIGLGSAAFVLCAVAHCLVSRNNNKLV